METAKIFTCGKSQAVKIPKEYRFDVNKVYVNKIGDALILTPVKKSTNLLRNELPGFTSDLKEETEQHG